MPHGKREHQDMDDDIVKIILFCSGNGADPNSYRPHSDETQWWGRRDALVRCVSSAFCACSNTVDTVELLFDDSVMRIQKKKKNSAEISPFLPTEKNWIRLWKRAAKTPHQWSEQDGFSCRLDRFVQGSSNRGASSSRSKREMLEHLHSICSMEFLREHHLNSSISVLLRKTSQSQLETVERLWHKKRKRSTTATSPVQDHIARILQPPPSAATTTKVIAATLHESSENELPCWDDELSNEKRPRIQLCLFLGAVRDMTPTEYDFLPSDTLRIRLGPVPEFSSKIIHGVAFHHTHQRLIPAVLHLQQQQEAARLHNPTESLGGALSHRGDSDDDGVPATYPSFHFVCYFPSLTEITTDLSQRSPALWCLVRCTVAALWRSHVVGRRQHRTRQAPQRLTLVMKQNALAITATTESMLHTMAEQHQAAPSEYQVLKAWQSLVESSDQTKSIDDLATIMKQATHIIDHTTTDATASLPNTGHKFYSKKKCTELLPQSSNSTKTATIVVVLSPLGGRPEFLKGQAVVSGDRIANTGSKSTEQQEQLMAAVTSITMLHHLAYQDRLVSQLLCMERRNS